MADQPRRTDSDGDGDAQGDTGVPMSTILRLGFAALALGAIAVFIVQNLDSVPVKFLSFSFDAPLIVLLAIAGGAGVIVRWLFRFWRNRRRR